MRIAVSSVNARAGTVNVTASLVSVSGSLPPLCPRTASRPARTSRWTRPCTSCAGANVRVGVIGKNAESAAVSVSGLDDTDAGAMDGTRYRTMSWLRVSSDATSPVASVNVSVTCVCTIVPDGSGDDD
jgi:hypothetical protein